MSAMERNDSENVNCAIMFSIRAVVSRWLCVGYLIVEAWA
jgi:hypothetical protein